MSIRRLGFYLLLAVLLISMTGISKKKPPATDQNVLVGRNVNMVSGITFADGDPYLQRQNEPSIAVSTRNPMHLLAGANDYRTIDIPFDFELPGLEEEKEVGQARDAWLGVFKSFDGGQSWISTLLPGFPQDCPSPSLLCDYDAACDPVVRAGANGLFYYSGMAFNRDEPRESAVFVARFIDNNNMEGRDTIKYIDTAIIANGEAEEGDDERKFRDKPWIAVDLPHTNSKKVKIVVPIGEDPFNTIEQYIPRSNVYIVYTEFTGSGENLRSTLYFVRSTDCGETWEEPINLSEGHHLNQGATIAIDPRGNGQVYVAWRRFSREGQSNAILFARSSNSGKKFHKVVEVASIEGPFDQGTSNYSFRTNSYPTLTVDDKGIVYLAWSQREGAPPQEEARIILTTSQNGNKWSTPKVIDSLGIGHQFMPSLTFAAGKLMMAWYDQRDDIAAQYDPDLAFKKYIDDEFIRHTIDVRVAQADPGQDPIFDPSIRVSRYLHIIDEDGYVKQVQLNPPNYPLFRQGTAPFHGDYVDITPSPMFLPTKNWRWVYNSEPYQGSVFHTVWTDNRDVRPPGGDWWGDWTNYGEWPLYQAPSSAQDPGYEPPPCTEALNTGMRNQNIYTASITSGISAGSLGNTKPADDVQHTFIVFVKNATSELKSFRLIINAPNASFRQNLEYRLSTLDIEVPPYSTVTRTVFVDPPHTNAPIRIDVVEIEAPDGSEIPGGLTDYILLNPDPTNPEVWDMFDPENPRVLNYEYHNPRVENPRVENYDFTNEDEMNPRVLNPRVENPRVLNPRVLNPRVENLGLLNPRVENISFLNPEMENPRVENPRVENTAMADVIWTVGNDGNTTSAYTLTMLSNAAEGGEIPDPDIIAQVLVYKIHTTPVEDGCTLREEHQDELVLNVTNPRVENPRVWNPRVENPRVENPRVENPRVENATFALAPGEEAYVVFRIWDDNVSGNTAGALSTGNVAAGGLSIEDVIGTEQEPKAGAALSGHAADTEDIEQDVYDPPVAYPPNYTPMIGYSPSSMTFTAPEGGLDDNESLFINNSGEGILDYTLNIEYENVGDTWLELDTYQGQHTAGDPPPQPNEHLVTAKPSGLSVGTYKADIVIEAPGASNSPQTVPVTLTISSPVGLTQFLVEAEGGGPIGSQTQLIPFNIRITALDGVGNTVESFTGTVDITSTGNLTAGYGTTANFTDGVLASHSVTISSMGSFTITATRTGGTESGTSNSFDVTAALPSSLWARTYGGLGNEVFSDVKQTSDGGFIVAGHKDLFGISKGNIWVLKLDRDGAIEWQKSYGGLQYEFMGSTSIQPTSGGGYILLGSIFSGAPENVDLWVLKLDRDGVIEWQKSYGGPSLEIGWDIHQTPDNNYIIAAEIIPVFEKADTWVLKIDSSGNVLWQWIYGEAGTDIDRITSIYPTPDDGFIMAGSTGQSWDEDAWVVKLDSSGSIQWQKTYDSSINNVTEVANKIRPTSYGGYIFSGSITSTIWPGRSSSAWVVKLDSSGDVEWTKRFGPPNYGQINPASDGGYILSGYSFSMGPETPLFNEEIYAIKLDSDGDILWSNSYGGDNQDRAPAQYLTSDGGYILAGYTCSFGAGNIDSWVLRIDANGDIGQSCGLIESVTVTESVPPLTPPGTAGATASITQVSPGDTTAFGSDSSAYVFTQCSTTVAGTETRISVETADDGFGTVVYKGNIWSGNSITVYAIARDDLGHFVANVAADSWSLVNKSGGVDDADLMHAGDMKSAVFTGHLLGSANIRAEKSGLTSIDSGTITVIVGTLDHFDFDTIGNQIAGVTFSITITAKDAGGNTVTSHTGPNVLSVTQGGTIDPTITGTFTDGVWTGDVTISTVQTGVTITTTGDGKSGTSNSFDVIVPPLSITTEELPPGIADGVSGCGYYPSDPPVKLEATGGNPPYTWSIVESLGTLPPGLDLNSNTGEITDVPEYESGATYPKNYGFTVQVTDSTPQSVSKLLSITVDLPTLGIGTPGLLDGVIGKVYDAPALIADCAIGNLNWEILAGGEFPPGLEFDGSTGLISGSPVLDEVSYPYTYNFTVKVIDSVGSRTASKLLRITIAKPLEITTPSTLPYGVAGVLYSPVTLSATGGIQPYQWPSGPIGGTGLSIDSNGVISGTPTTVGVHQGVVVEVHDSASPGQGASKQFNIVIHSSAPPSGLVSWWSGDNNAFDYINGNHGTLYEGTTYAGGMVEDAFSFDGVDDYVLATGTGINGLDVLTIELWVKLNSLQDDIDRFVTIGPPGCPKACLRHEAGGTGMLHFYMCINSTLQNISVDGVLQTGCWHHVAGTYDGSHMRVYLDGTEVGNLPISGTVATGNDEVYIGYPHPEGQHSHEVLDGLLDEVKIYDHALEASEIQAIYDAGDPEKMCIPLIDPFTKIMTGAIVEDEGYSHGCAWGDYDNDGNLDLFVPNYSQNNFLYTNNGYGSFTKVTSGVVVTDVGNSYGCAWGDYDNDGNLDLFVPNNGQNDFLYTNNGDGNFTKITSGEVVTDVGNSYACAWGDYDNDGNLDLFVPNGADQNNFLYTNNGDGSFTKGTSGVVVTDGGDSRGCAWGDYDNDGDLDLFVPNFNQKNFLYMNNGDGSFTKVTSDVVVTDGGNSVSCAWGDYDNDGDLDLFVPNYTDQNNFLYMNNGDGSFTKVTSDVVVTDGGDSFACAWGDYNNDGDLDLFVSNTGNNFLYTNNGDGSFTKVTSGVVVTDGGNSIGCAWGDYNNDGDLDLFVPNQDQNNFLYANNGNSNNWINIKCIGIASNVSAIGAKVKVLATIKGDPVWQLREISGGTLSQDSLNAEFGLSDATIVDEIRIEWPSGNVQSLEVESVNQFLTVTETETYEFVTKWGSYGTGDGQFSYPKGIAVDSSGYVYVADWNYHRVQKFTSSGSFVTKWGSNGTGDGEFYYPNGIALDSSGYVYVAEEVGNRVQKFKKIE